MEAPLAVADSILHDPLRSAAKSLLINATTAGPHLVLDDRIVLCGEVVSALQEELVLAILLFMPFRGFEAASGAEKMVQVKIPGLGDRTIHCAAGVQVMCAGKPVFWDENRYEFDQQVVMTFKPEFSEAMPWNFLHLFYGSFAGWSQAASFLHKADNVFSLGQEISVDNDETVMQIWSARAGSVHLRSPVTFDTPWSPAQQVGILASDSDCSLVNLCRIQANLCVQCRHPAKVGLGRWQAQGAPGQQYCWAFIQAIEVAAIAQPVVIAAECSDEITEHPLFKIIEALLQALGFRRTWTQVTPYQNLADHSRSRWLVVHVGEG